MRVKTDARGVADSARHAARSARPTDLRVAVIGAGMSGLLAAIEFECATFHRVFAESFSSLASQAIHSSSAAESISCTLRRAHRTAV